MLQRTRAQESRAAIERLYITMRHLFNRGYYKPMGVSGEALINALLTLRPEIYGSIADPGKVELDGLLYVMERLPKGIEECRYIKLTSEEGFDDSAFEVLIPTKRRRNCYRIDEELMVIELTRGRSEIYDILTHLTFLNIESEKIKRCALNEKGNKTREWIKLEEIASEGKKIQGKEKKLALVYLSTILGRTYDETEKANEKFNLSTNNNDLFHIVFWLGRLALQEEIEQKSREIHFSSTLRERIGHHIYGERWAEGIKSFLRKKGLLKRPLHIISANLHSVMNAIYASPALNTKARSKDLDNLAVDLSQARNATLQNKVAEYAEKHGMYFLKDFSKTNISVQIIDTEEIDPDKISRELNADIEYLKKEKPVIFVMDYAFGEQAFETMDELLKPFEVDGQLTPLNVKSISVMGKAGILSGKKGDIMIPNAHLFEGTADNYPIDNEFELTSQEALNANVQVFKGPMITVLGTSLQNKDILEYFKDSSWGVIGLEMEGAHLQKAIQAASRIRKSINDQIIVSYAYYASDNPLVTGSTLASGSLGKEGVRPTYLITKAFLRKILGGN